jgi:hypothetical protein
MDCRPEGTNPWADFFSLSEGRFLQRLNTPWEVANEGTQAALDV